MSTESNMIARAIPKKDTQAMIKALRAAKLDVVKDSTGGYTCKDPIWGKLLFRALPGRRNYLVRMRRDLFV